MPPLVTGTITHERVWPNTDCRVAPLPPTPFCCPVIGAAAGRRGFLPSPKADVAEKRRKEQGHLLSAQALLTWASLGRGPAPTQEGSRVLAGWAPVWAESRFWTGPQAAGLAEALQVLPREASGLGVAPRAVAHPPGPGASCPDCSRAGSFRLPVCVA